MRRIQYQSPIGVITLEADDHALLRVQLPNQSHISMNEESLPNDVLRLAVKEFQDYFEGRLTRFTVPYLLNGTAFQIEVWKALEELAFGQILAYGEIARRINRPRSVRAVGAALGANPLPIVLPCHRVIARNGALTGFSGGITCKAWLLEHEATQMKLMF